MLKKRSAFSITPYLYVFPLVLCVGIVLIGSLGFNIVNSFYDWNGLTPEKTYIGIKNYKQFFSSDIFWIIMKNTLINFIFGVGLHMFFGLIWAYILKFSIFGKNLTAIVRTIVFFPVVLSPALIAYMFAKFYEPTFGSFNTILRSIGLESLTSSWTSDPKISLACIIFVVVWEWTGLDMVMYTSGLSGISQEVFESAQIDGANHFVLFTKIVFPLLKQSHVTLTILGAIGALKMFDLTWIMTKGGPGNVTEFFSTHIYKMGLESSRVGYASAVGNVLFIIAFVVTLLQLKLYMKDE